MAVGVVKVLVTLVKGAGVEELEREAKAAAEEEGRGARVRRCRSRPSCEGGSRSSLRRSIGVWRSVQGLCSRRVEFCLHLKTRRLAVASDDHSAHTACTS